MGTYDDKMEAKLGIVILNLILEAVRDGVIDRKKMRDIAQLLHSSVGGRHKMRVNDQREDSYDTEMREVLSDWYGKEMYKLDKTAAVNKLIDVFESSKIDLKPLAENLRQAIGGYSAATAHLPLNIAPSPSINHHPSGQHNFTKYALLVLVVAVLISAAFYGLRSQTPSPGPPTDAMACLEDVLRDEIPKSHRPGEG